MYNDIIEGCRQGNRRSQEALYRAYYKAMVTICLRYTKNEEDAVEVLNNGFLKVFQNIKRYDESVASLYTWMRTIVVNACVDFVKRKNTLTDRSERVVHADVPLPPEALTRLDAVALLTLVRSLPPATAAVFNLYAVEGYGHKEIGALLGISEGTSKWHLSEARKSLQQKLKLQDANP